MSMALSLNYGYSSMKLNKLSTLQELGTIKPLPTLKPLLSSYTSVTIDKSRLSEVGLICYTSDLCLFSMRILRNEITVPNRDAVLRSTMIELSKLNALLHKGDYYTHSTYTVKDTKNFFKQVGLKPKHISTERTTSN